jgi:hypothetical protein
MNLSRVCVALVLFNLAAATMRLAAQPSPPPPLPPAPAAGGAGENSVKSAEGGAGPLIQFDQKEYNWGKVESGEFVKHVFTVTNTGTQTLEITRVHPSCGCTTAGDWTKRIEPGQSGVIPIQFNSAGKSGPITKTIDITSNAKDHPRETLFIRGTVWKSIEVTPQMPVINLVADATNSPSTSVRITTQADQPVEISDPVSSSKSFTAELLTNTPGKEYKLIVTVLPPFAVGSPTATIDLKTSLPSTPILSVKVMATIQPEIQVSPPQLRLGTLPNVWTTNHSIFIRGNGAAPVTLSDPECSDPRVHAQLSPVGVAGMYNLQVALPPNYQIEPGQPVEISVKSNNPRHPIVQVPLVQYARGAAAASPAYSSLPVHGVQAIPPAAGHP